MKRTISSSLVILLAATALAAKQQEASGKSPTPAGSIASIRVTGSQHYPQAQIVLASGLQVGDTVTKEDIQGATNRLLQLGLFSEVHFRYTSSGETVHLEFMVVEAPRVPVSFDNFPWLTDEELTQAIRESVSLFDGTAPEHGTVLDLMTQSLQELLAKHNIRGTLEHSLMAQPAGTGMMQQFKVVGASLKVEAVELSDALAADAPRVRERLSDVVGKPYSRFAIEVFANEQVRPVYLERGHLRVRFGRPQARFTGPPDRPLADRVLVILPIEPGAAYHWDGVQWRGNAAMNQAALDALVPLKKDETADGVKLASLWLRVQEEYGRRGYLDAKGEPEPTFDDASQHVSYRVAIIEGVQYRMGELVITGLSLAGEHRLLDAWHMPRGQVFDRIYFDDFLQGIKQVFTGTPIRFDTVGHWLRTDAQKRTVDVLLDFR